MRPIDADIKVSDYIETWQCKCSENGTQTVMAVEDLQYLPTIDPIRAAGGCRCGECKKHMTPECLLCSFDVDGSCTGGPESDFYCGDSELEEAQDDG